MRQRQLRQVAPRDDDISRFEHSRPAPGIRAYSRWIFNCYVVEDGGSGRPLVVDPGIPANGAAALDALRGLVADPGSAVVTATHAHSDHVAGMPAIYRAVRAPIYLPAKVRDYLASERPRNPGLRAVARIAPMLFDQPFELRALIEFVSSSRSAGFGAGPFRFDLPIAGFLDDGARVVDAPDWQILQTPGHTDCSTCLWNADTQTLLSGDTILTHAGRAWFTPETTDDRLMARSEERLRQLPVRHLLPGHGRPISGADIMGDAVSHRVHSRPDWWRRR